jgi:hypothetical protein
MLDNPILLPTLLNIMLINDLVKLFRSEVVQELIQSFLRADRDLAESLLDVYMRIFRSV